MKFGLWRINLAVAKAVLTSRGVEPYLPVRLTSLGVRKMCAPLRAASVAISFGSTIWQAPKVSWIPGTSSVTSWSIGWIAPWMIFGKNRFFNNFCGQFPLVVKVATFGSLLGSLFGLLTASASSQNRLWNQPVPWNCLYRQPVPRNRSVQNL